MVMGRWVGSASARTSVLLWRESTSSWEKRTGVSLEGVLVTVRAAENSIASERVCCQKSGCNGVALRIGVEELGSHTFAKREMAPATQVLTVNFPL